MRLPWVKRRFALFDGVDATPPSAPMSLTVPTWDYNQIDLSWTAVPDAVSYNVYKDAVFLASNADTTYSATGLTELTEYDFYVTAVDLVGNESAPSNAVTKTTKYQITKAAEFALGASAAYYRLTDSDNYSLGDSSTEMSILFRVRLDSDGSIESYFFNKIGAGGSHEYTGRRNASGANRTFELSLGSNFTTNIGTWDNIFTGTVDTWVDLAILIDLSEATAIDRVLLVKDGALAGVDGKANAMAAGAWPTSVANMATDLVIPARVDNPNGTDTDGRIADFQIYRRKITLQEAQDARNRILPSPAPSLWLRMHDDNDGDSSSADGDTGGAVNKVVNSAGTTVGSILGTTSSWQLVSYP